MFKKILLFFIIFSCLFSAKTTVFAEECNPSACDSGQTDCLNRVRDACLQQINNSQKTQNTLSNQIKILDSNISLTLVQITQTATTIKTLESDIAGLTVKIGQLNEYLNKLSSDYIKEVSQNYKLEKRVPTFTYLLSAKFNDYYERQKYIATIQKNSQNNLVNMETTRINFDNEKQQKTLKQAELESLQKTLASQQNSLNSQKSAKNSLLAVTKNDEKKYQQLLITVQNKLASLNNTSTGCLSGPAGGGSDGNYYSQIDKRWCTNYIGMQTKYTIGGAGCYLTSMSMVFKKLGFDIRPDVYASDPGRFSSSADLIDPTPPSGYVYKKYTGFNTSIIDGELKSGRYVIAQVPMKGSVSGYHFIVIISGSNGNYKIHDPWHGADLNFSQYYSTVISIRLITK